MNEEEYLIFQIEEIKKSYMTTIEPYLRRLAAIRNSRMSSYPFTVTEYEQLTSTELAQITKTDSPSVSK